MDLTQLESFVKLGMPIVLSLLVVGGLVDLYNLLKKNWIPSFLESFARIADSSENTTRTIGKLEQGFNKMNSSFEKFTNSFNTKIEVLDEDLKVVKNKIEKLVA